MHGLLFFILKFNKFSWICISSFECVFGTISRHFKWLVLFCFIFYNFHQLNCSFAGKCIHWHPYSTMLEVLELLSSHNKYTRQQTGNERLLLSIHHVCFLPYHFDFMNVNFDLLSLDFWNSAPNSPLPDTLGFHLSFCSFYENQYSWECLSSSLKSLALFLHSRFLCALHVDLINVSSLPSFLPSWASFTMLCLRFKG